MNDRVEVQYAVEGVGLPASLALQRWALAALGPATESELVIRLCAAGESRTLNKTYRHTDSATNVLSFAFEQPPGMHLPHLGDLVICAPVVQREAREQGKSPEAHWAHMVVHGVLHLRGYDHQDPAAADAMEALEREILAGLGFSDPYAVPPRQDAG